MSKLYINLFQELLKSTKIEFTDFKSFIIKKKLKSTIIFCDKKLKDLLPFLNECSNNVFYISGGEKVKSLKNVNIILNIFHKYEINRGHEIICVGGGSLLDLLGFCCSIWHRGLNLILVPTTLLAMTDASIGGKNAINFKNYKNLIGTIYFPTKILIDLKFLNTLKKKQIKDGLSEIIKHGLLKSKRLVTDLIDKKLNFNTIKDVLFKSISIKCKIITKDPCERKERFLLNFGHTLGHSIEKTFRVSHGLSVFNGMFYETIFNVSFIGGINQSVVEVLKELKCKYNYKLFSKEEITKKVIDKLKYDKKIIEKEINLPIVYDVGKSKIIKVNAKKYIQEMEKFFQFNN